MNITDMNINDIIDIMLTPPFLIRHGIIKKWKIISYPGFFKYSPWLHYVMIFTSYDRILKHIVPLGFFKSSHLLRRNDFHFVYRIISYTFKSGRVFFDRSRQRIKRCSFLGADHMISIGPAADFSDGDNCWWLFMSKIFVNFLPEWLSLWSASHFQ